MQQETLATFLQSQCRHVILVHLCCQDTKAVCSQSTVCPVDQESRFDTYANGSMYNTVIQALAGAFPGLACSLTFAAFRQAVQGLPG